MTDAEASAEALDGEAPRRVPPAVWALVAAGLVAYGLSAVLIRAAGPVEPLALAAWRTAFVALLLAPPTLLRARGELAAMPARSWALIGVSGVLLGLHFSAWISAVQLTTVAAAAVLVTTSPLFVGAAGLVGFGARPGRRTLLAIAVGVAGAVLIGFGGAGGGPVPPQPALGNGLAFGAALLIAVYYLVGASVRQGASFLAYFMPVNAVAALTAGVVCVATGTPLGLTPTAILWCAAMAVGPGLIGHGSFAFALGYVPAATLSLLTLAEPVIATAGAAVVFRETPGAAVLAGMACVLASIGVVVKRRATTS